MDILLYQFFLLLFFVSILNSEFLYTLIFLFLTFGVYQHYPSLSINSVFDKLRYETFKTTVSENPIANELNGDLKVTSITKDDPFQNLEVDPLKRIGNESDELRTTLAKSSFYTDVSEFGYKTMDRILYTTPPDDQESYAEFLGYNVKRDTGTPKYEDPKQSRRDYTLI